jgi:hypothetical protein
VQQVASSLQKPTNLLFIFPPGISSCWYYVKTTMQRKATASLRILYKSDRFQPNGWLPLGNRRETRWD